MQIHPKPKFAIASNTKTKDASWALALRTVATEGVVSNTSTALKRGTIRSLGGAQIRNSAFVAMCSKKNTSKFSASKLCLLVQSNGKSKPEKGTEVVLTTFLLSKLWWHLEPTKPRWRSTFHANYLSVLANHSLNRTHCSVPSFGL